MGRSLREELFRARQVSWANAMASIIGKYSEYLPSLEKEFPPTWDGPFFGGRLKKAAQADPRRQAAARQVTIEGSDLSPVPGVERLGYVPRPRSRPGR